jgi:D-isomer specific 2-hydroxyacid dehydrogenase-like protein
LTLADIAYPSEACIVTGLATILKDHVSVTVNRAASDLARLSSAASFGSVTVRRGWPGFELDVFEHEPLPAGHLLYKLVNVLLSPHCADHTDDWQDQAMRVFPEQYGRFEKGEPLKNIVNKRLSSKENAPKRASSPPSRRIIEGAPL